MRHGEKSGMIKYPYIIFIAVLMLFVVIEKTNTCAHRHASAFQVLQCEGLETPQVTVEFLLHGTCAN